MASTYLSRATGSSSTTSTKATFSAWLKINNLGTNGCFFGHHQDNTIRSAYYIMTTGQFKFFSEANDILVTNRIFRDPNAWYHVVIAWDTTQATISDRVKLYINGVQETSFSSSSGSYPAQNSTGVIPAFGTQTVGVNIYNGSPDLYFNGSMAHVHFVEGTAYAASDFGQTDTASGIWKPKTSPSVTYGTNGFFLKFANSGSLGTDSSGNANNFTVNGTGTQTLDTPSNVFATMNPLIPFNAASSNNGSFSNGNTSVSYSNTYGYTFGTLGVSKGKYYWEVKTNITGTANGTGVGFQDMDNLYDPTNYPGTNVYVYTNVGTVRSPAGDNVSYGDSYTTSTIGVALDLDNGKAYFSKDGVWQNSGDPTSGATGTGAAFSFTVDGTYVAYSADNASATSSVSYDFNFGNGYFGTTAVSSGNADGDGYGIFEYAPPTGYYALCTKNINTYG